MRVLLVAYEFPPSPSPQSLRWAYLVRELHALGHEVHVLTADLGGETPGLPGIPDGVHVHRTFPGPLRGALAWHRDYRMRNPRPVAAVAHGGDGSATVAPAAALRPPRNWKQRISETVQSVAAWVHFPDIRGEWRRWGLRELRRLLATLDPDVVVSSHEPATTMELVLAAIDGERPWIADLGDPVLAPYTPRRWRRRSARIERATCARADAIVVTSDATRELLRQRYGRNDGVHVVTQGFDAASIDAAVPPDALFDADRLELLYTGSLYAFRRIDALLDALRRVPQARLGIAAVTVPEAILAAARALPDQVRLLGFLPHRAALALQRQADVLVNLANDDPVQVPGKFYEYLGAGRPILHLGDAPDAVAARIAALHRGWTCANDAEAIAALLHGLASAKSARRLDAGLSLDRAVVDEHSWQRLGQRMDRVLREAAAGRDDPPDESR